MSKRARILLLLPHLGGGGAEKVLLLLAQHLSREKYEVHLGLITQSAANYEGVDGGFTLHPLGARRVRTSSWRVVRLVRRLRPQIILSGMFQLNFLVLLLRPFFPRHVKILIRQNGTVSSALAFGDLAGYHRVLYRLLYRRADRVLCQSKAMADDMVRELDIDPGLLSIVSNPIDTQGLRAAMDEGRADESTNLTGIHLLAVARLSREKGLDLLLDALATLRQRFPTADLVIAGSGEEERALRLQCEQLGLEDMVRFAGHVARPAVLFGQATLFVLASRHEGMPNALLEAAACGLPLVTTPASQGIADLLQGRRGAWVSKAISAVSLAESLIDAIENTRACKRFDHDFMEPFQLDNSIPAYEKVIDSELASLPHSDSGR